jgi:hypothetical protein
MEHKRESDEPIIQFRSTRISVLWWFAKVGLKEKNALSLYFAVFGGFFTSSFTSN